MFILFLTVFSDIAALAILVWQSLPYIMACVLPNCTAKRHNGGLSVDMVAMSLAASVFLTPSEVETYEITGFEMFHWLLNTATYAVVFLSLSLTPPHPSGPGTWQVVQCDSVVLRCPLLLRWPIAVAAAAVFVCIIGVLAPDFPGSIVAGLYLDSFGRVAQMWLWRSVTTRRRDPKVSAYFVLLACSRMSEVEGLVMSALTPIEWVVFGLPIALTGVLAFVHIGWAVTNKYDMHVNHMA